GPGVTIVPLDAFLLRLDLDPLTFEALGNDQNYKEVCKDQNGETEFRFQYALLAHADGYDQSWAVAASRAAGTPLVVARGRIERGWTWHPLVYSPTHGSAVITCLKPVDADTSGACIMRLWETAGKAGLCRIDVRGYKRVFLTDLLERDLAELKIENTAVNVPLRPHGLAALRLLP
ncbi:MAG: hypothetical protein NTX87_00515, partial [Planctomycetota bacterium]|nr:hypothetical protein [Planctomycetota bacterium]